MERVLTDEPEMTMVTKKGIPVYNIRFMIHESLVREDDPEPFLSLVCFSI